jgi:hypothetical protein
MDTQSHSSSYIYPSSIGRHSFHLDSNYNQDASRAKLVYQHLAQYDDKIFTNETESSNQLNQ